MNELENARKQINEIDRKMAELFCSRMKAVRTVADYKRKQGLPVLDTGREKAVVSRNSSLVTDSELQSYYINFITDIMSISRSYQHRLLEGMRVAYCGVKGAFSNIAAERIFPNANAVSYPDFTAAYNSVVSGECDCAVLPIENSYAGEVSKVMDLTFFGPLSINGVYDLEVLQNLLGVPGATVSDIKEVVSHPQALSQCAEYIRDKGFVPIEASNTAAAAKQVAADGDKSVAAIASIETAKLYGLNVLDRNINENSNNTTRFAVYSRAHSEQPNVSDRFIMMFTVKNEAGCLGRAVSVIGENGFNLKALRSRPTKELIWNYYFYAEGEGDIYSENGARMLDALKEHCSNLKIVGSYSNEKLLKD